MEGDFLVHHVVDCSIDEESEELGEVFVQVKDFHHDQQSEKLGAVGTSESDQEKRDFTAEFTGTGRKYPVFAPEEVVDLRNHIGSDVGSDIVAIELVHHQPDNQDCNQRIQRTDQYKPDHAYHIFRL